MIEMLAKESGVIYNPQHNCRGDRYLPIYAEEPRARMVPISSPHNKLDNFIFAHLSGVIS